MAEELEKEHVHKVYNLIAQHFSDTRHKPWPVVEKFLKSLPVSSIGADVGCGNGKYIGVNSDIYMIGSDRSNELIGICGKRGFEAMDFAISIAVIHHFSTEERRFNAVKEIARIVKKRGRILIFVWAFEQITGKRNFTEQDSMVDWKLPKRYKDDQEEIVYQRYYHVFKQGELERLVEPFGTIIEHGYDRDNHYIGSRPDAPWFYNHPIAQDTGNSISGWLDSMTLGISFKSQLLYAIVFCTRYLDLFTHFVSFYNTIMKIIFISSSFYILYLMKVKFKASWDPKLDTFRIEFLIIPCAILSLIFHSGKFSFMEITWAFSIYLEAVAIMPQLFQLSRTGEAETITSHYLFALGGYRGLYILNWIYRYATEPHFHDWISVFAGIIQTALYADFFYVYFSRVLKGKKFRLPA